MEVKTKHTEQHIVLASGTTAYLDWTTVLVSFGDIKIRIPNARWLAIAELITGKGMSESKPVVRDITS